MNVSRFKILLRSPQKVVRLAVLKDVPIFAHIYITRTCNLHCAKCRVIQRKSQELSTREWKKIMDRMAEWGTRIVTIQGGEAMLRPDIFEILEYASKKFYTTFFTNAVLLDKKKIDRLIATGISNLAMSLDSLHAAREAKMGRGSIAANKVVEALEYLQTLEKKPKVSVNAVVTRLNLEELPDLARFANEHGAFFSVAALESAQGDRWWFRNYAPELEIPKKDFKKLEKIIETLVEMKKSGHKISNDITQLRNLVKYVRGQYRIKCGAGRLYYSVNADGRFMACQDLAPTSKRVDEMKTIREAWKDKKMAFDIASCQGCYYGCYVSLVDLVDHPLRFFMGEMLY